MVRTNTPGFALAGYTFSNEKIYSDAWLIKTDSEGIELWNKTYGKIRDEYASTLFQTADNGYLMGGTAGFNVFSNKDLWLLKTDELGDMVWNYTYGSRSNNGLRTFYPTLDNGFVFAGYTYSSHAGQSDIRLIKIDSDGSMLWDRSYGGTADEEAYAIIQTTEGDFILTGFTNSYGIGKTDIWFVITDVNGNMKQYHTFGGFGYDEASDLIQTSDGGFVLAGSTTSYGEGGTDILLLKIDSNGVLEWNHTYGGPEYDGASALIQTLDGGFAFAGYTDSYGAGDSDMWIVKVDKEGQLEWYETFGGEKSEGASDLIQNANGDYLLVGYSSSYGAGGNDICLVKISTNHSIFTDIPVNLSGIAILIVLLIAIWRIKIEKKSKQNNDY